MDAWSRLASAAPNSNVYYSPGFLVPNLEHVEHRPFVLLLIYQDTPADRSPDLIAFAPFTVNAPTRSRPFVHLESFANRYVYQTNPLVDPRHAEAAWDALFEVLQDPSQIWQLTDMKCEAEPEGLPPALIHRLTADHTISCRKEPSRACLHKPITFQEFEQSLGGKTRYNRRRALHKLSDLGAVEFRLHRHCDDVAALVDDFLALERSGWKGPDRGAMAYKDGDVRFLHQVSRHSNTLEGLYYVELRLNGQLIGCSVAHTQGSTLFAFKIAYDEHFARYSPGVLVAVETLRRFIGDPHLTHAHSGANTESWVHRYFKHIHEQYSFCIPTRRPLAQAFTWGLKSFGRLRRLEASGGVATRE